MYISQSNFTHRKTTDLKTHEEIDLQMLNLSTVHRTLLRLDFFFKKSLLLACPTHTNPPGSGLGTGGFQFDKHIDKSTQQMN